MKENTKNLDLRGELKLLLKQLHSGADVEKLKEKGKNILGGISPTDLALMEQEIIQEGITRKEMRKLCDIHLEIMKDSLSKTDIKLQPGHPIHTLIEEHKMILEFIDKLQQTVDSLESAKGFTEVTGEIEMLKHIAEHLIEADKHHQREEEVLFPRMERFGITEPPQIMKEEHTDLKAKKNALYAAARKNKGAYAVFFSEVKRNADFLINGLPNHIYKEDNILYPMALQVIPKKEWTAIEEKCDRIGYCCFTPKY